jgi:hypothetical protein
METPNYSSSAVKISLFEIVGALFGSRLVFNFGYGRNECPGRFSKEIIMRQFKIGVVLLILAQFACSSFGPASPPPGAAAVTETPASTATAGAAAVTETLAPTATASPEPAPTPQDLEVLEWAVYPYANLADPQNTDMRLEILVRNPNEFPVRVHLDEVELRLLTAAGEIAYTNANPTFYIWEGSWILGGETVPISACVCFQTDGVEKQAWESLELVVPLEAAASIAYTTDVDVTLGEFFSLEQAHLGGDTLGAEINLVNTSGQILKSFEVRVIARDAGGKYVGVAIYGSFADRNNSGAIEPGASGGGIVVSEIDYVDEPLVYEVTAIGIPAK